MERTRDTLLLALYALLDPPDGMLVHRRAAAVKEHDGGGAVGDATPCGRGGGEKAVGVSLDGARVDSHAEDPTQKGGRGYGCGAVAVEEVSYEGATPRDNRSLDATRTGCGASAAGSALVDEHRGSEGRPLHEHSYGRTSQEGPPCAASGLGASARYKSASTSMSATNNVDVNRYDPMPQWQS